MNDTKKSAAGTGSRLPMVVALLALLVSCVFGFGLTQNIAGLRGEVASVAQQSAVKDELAALRQDVDGMRKRLDGIADLDVVARRAVLAASVTELTQRIGLLAGTVDNDDYARKLNEAMRLMQEIQNDLDAQQ